MPAKRAPRPPEETGYTLRLPIALVARIRERALALTAKGEGKWTSGMVMQRAITDAAKTWDTESDK